ncbi:MAG TPA: RNA methyltransferase [Candidatus Binatia bacterium]|nr:RNA methyltransferase [Candidatus Binatia bacterium]
MGQGHSGNEGVSPGLLPIEVPFAHCLSAPMSENLRIVMVRPRGSGNIGSVARVMKNFGARDLAIVGNARTKSFWARAMAVHGRDVLAGARGYGSIREAIADCALVVGTTCRSGLYRSHSQTPRQLAPAIVAAAQKAKVALLFGPEDHGLSNKDLEHCQLLATIPASDDYPSLNVAQAAGICLYEIYVAAMAPVAPALERAQAEHIERLFDIMRAALLKIGFLDSENPEHMLLAFRRILGRAGLEAKDVRILTGLFRQIEWYAGGGWRIVEEKEQQGLKIR